jgi:putative hydrolase of the HAD superfamily
MSIKAIFFDAAGTLMFLPRPVGEHYSEVAMRFGAELSADALQRAFRRAWSAAPARTASPGPRPDDDKGWWRGLVGRVLDQTLTPEQQLSFAHAAYFEAVYGHFAEPGVWELFPEVPEVLAGLKERGFRLAVISNFDRRLHPILEALGIRGFFKSVILSSEAGADKPDPQIFRLGLEAMGVAAAEAIHVGDDPERDGGAEAVGIRVFHLDRPGIALNGLPAWLERMSAPRQDRLPEERGEAK